MAHLRLCLESPRPEENCRSRVRTSSLAWNRIAPVTRCRTAYHCYPSQKQTTTVSRHHSPLLFRDKPPPLILWVSNFIRSDPPSACPAVTSEGMRSTRYQGQYRDTPIEHRHLGLSPNDDVRAPPRRTYRTSSDLAALS